MPRVSVLIPSYNSIATMSECLNSVLRQTFRDFEVVVGDNASTDGSLGVISECGDSRVRVVARQRNVGWVNNLNMLIRDEAIADMVAVLHADDWWDPDFLAHMVEALDAFPPAVCSACGVRVHHPDGQVTVDGMPCDIGSEQPTLVPSRHAVRLLARRNRLLAPSVLARRSLYDSLPDFEVTLPLCCDWLMWLRAATSGPIAVTPNLLAHYRLHSNNLSSQGHRSLLWGLDEIRMLRIAAVDWADAVPYPEALADLTNTVTRQLAARARAHADDGDRSAALFYARLTSAASGRPSERALAALLELVLASTATGPLRPLRGPALEAGRRLRRTIFGRQV